MSKLSVKYNLVNDSNVYEYKESIRNVHQYSGVDLNIHKSSLDSFITVKINKYPYTYLNYPSTTYEWKPNQWLFMKDDENEKYKRCSEFYDETAEYFLFPSDYFTSGGLYEFTVTPIFNISGNYAITIDEYSQTDNSLLNELVIYVEVVDIKTLNITTPFDGEGDEFGGWNKSVSKDVYTLLQQNSNDFRMCIYSGEESGNEIIGNLYGIDSDVYNGFNDTLFYIKENDTEKEVYGVVVEAFVENCFIRESSDSDYLNQVKICKLAFSGVYKTFPSSMFSDSCKVYFDGVNFKLNNENKGVIVGSYDAERGVLSLERGFSADDINSLITGDFGDMLVSRSDSWGLLKAGRKGSVLTIDESNGVKFPRWKMPSSVYGEYRQYVNVYSDKFQIKNGDALKFTEIYSNDSINIEESGVDVFTLDENDGSVYLGDLEPTSYIITTSEDVEFIPPTEDWFEGYKYNIDFDGEETRFVINNDEIPERLIPEETSLVKYAKKGAVATSEVETNDVEAKSGELLIKSFYSAGENSPIMWYLFGDGSDLSYKLFDSEKNEFATGTKHFFNDYPQSVFSNFDFYGLDGLKGILAITKDYIEDEKDIQTIVLTTNIKNEFTDYSDFQSYSDSLHIIIGNNIDDQLSEIPIIKIIKHENFYTLYYVGVCYDGNNPYLRIGCISFVVNFTADEDSGIEIVRHTTTTYTENYSVIENNNTYVPKFYVESINKQNDVILFNSENDNWKVFLSSEVNSFGDMSINYYTDLTSNIFTSSSEIKALDIAKVSENICAVASLEQVDTDTVINRMRLLVYKETLDTENIDVQGKRYIKSIDIIEESQFASYNYLLQSPIMNNYTVSFEQGILGNTYNLPIKIIGIGKDSFAVFYKALNYLRCAIGTVGTYIDSEGNTKYDIFWQETKNALAVDANYLYSRKLAKAKDSNGNDKVLLCYNFNDTGVTRVEGITKLMTFSTVYEDNIMGVAGLYDEGYRMISYKGEVDTDSLNNTNIGVNVYCDDFGNLTEVHTKNYIGQYIGNGRIVKN